LIERKRRPGIAVPVSVPVEPAAGRGGPDDDCGRGVRSGRCLDTPRAT